MFSFSDNNPTIQESCISLDDAQEKYQDKYMIVTNVKVVDERIHGDIVAVLSAEELVTEMYKCPFFTSI